MVVLFCKCGRVYIFLNERILFKNKGTNKINCDFKNYRWVSNILSHLQTTFIFRILNPSKNEY